MNQTKDGTELILVGEVVEVTPLSSLRMSGVAPVRTSHGLVRLASASGRLEAIPDLLARPATQRRPDWRRLRQRALRTTETVVNA